ncbi:3564_t:CDS:2, partial [Racocetra fulgida]
APKVVLLTRENFIKILRDIEQNEKEITIDDDEEPGNSLTEIGIQESAQNSSFDVEEDSTLQINTQIYNDSGDLISIPSRLKEKKVYIKIRNSFNISYNAEILALEKKIKDLKNLKNYEELQNKFKRLIDENKKLKHKKFKISNENEILKKIFNQHITKFIEILNKKTLHEELSIEQHEELSIEQKFIEILNKKTLHEGLSIEQKFNDIVNMRTEFIMAEILNDFEIQRKTDHKNDQLWRETNFVNSKKSQLIQIITNDEDKLKRLDTEVENVVDKLKKKIEAKIKLDFEKEINFESSKSKLEKQINELEENDDFKMLHKIVDDLIKENRDLEDFNYTKSKYITELIKEINFKLKWKNLNK